MPTSIAIVKDDLRGRLLALLGLLAAVLILYVVWARPIQLHWGATDEEVQRPMPGDELNPHPDLLATRAITINDSPENIWPWLMQMGYGRAGLYGFDLFRAAGSSTAGGSADRILPQFQDFSVGDRVQESPFNTLTFHNIRPYETIVWSDDNGNPAITWALYPVDATHTRLVNRSRRSYHWAEPGQLPLDLSTELTDHLAVRKFLQGIQGRVEGNIEPRSDLNIELLLYGGVLLAFIWAAISVMRLPPSLGSWLVGLMGGLAWLTSWYAPVSIWVGATLALLVVWAVRVEYRDLQRTKLAQKAKARTTRPPGR